MRILLILLLLASCNGKPDNIYHKCIDPTHEQCDGKCECDGLGCHENKPPIKIIQSFTDDRGLTSIVFIQDGDTNALDYLTPEELQSLTQ